MDQSQFLQKSVRATPTAPQTYALLKLFLRLCWWNKWSVTLMVGFGLATAAIPDALWRVPAILLTSLYGMIVGAKFYIDIQPDVESTHNQTEQPEL